MRPRRSRCGNFFGTQFGDWFVARTGYTGEDGFEVTLPAEARRALWKRLNDLGVRSCGLGARDTLRLEAGMNLYGNDMDESTHPLEIGPRRGPSRSNPLRDALSAARRLKVLAVPAEGTAR